VKASLAHSRSWFLVAAWSLILAAAWYDSQFAWQYRLTFADWEQNPLMRAVGARFGVAAAIACKCMALCFALGLGAYCHLHAPRLEHRLVGLIGLAYLLLAGHYLLGQMASSNISGVPSDRLPVPAATTPQATLATTVWD
jgi:hypothetical protein